MDEGQSFYGVIGFNFFSQSGGLLYHLRASKSKNARWMPFRFSLEKELLFWSESLPKDVLVVVGGSGGYALTTCFVTQFQKIILIDMDPLAGFFFRRTHRGVPVDFISQNIFAQNTIEDLKQKHPKALWLWSNLLGQLGLSHSEVEVKRLLYRVNENMRGCSWFSFHDVFSFESQLQGPLELTDHLTQGHLELAHKTVHCWNLKARQYHLIESGFTSSSL